MKIFITGGAGVLGTAYARRLLDDGHHLIISDIAPKLELLKLRFGDEERCTFLELDVTDEDAVNNIFSGFANESSPDVILNNAAITSELLAKNGQAAPSFSETSLSQWNKTLDVNLTGPFLIARAIDRYLVSERSQIRLINVSSMYALKGPHHDIYKGTSIKSFAAYSATKAGIHGLTLWLASYWGQRCLVNTFAPGAVFNGHDEPFLGRVSELMPLKRMAQPAEIANYMSFLCSDDFSYVTGQFINVDGGFSAW